MIPRHLIIGVAAMLAVALGMSLYAWRMRGRATQAELPAEYAHPVAAPVQGPTEQVTLYVAYDDPGVLRAQPASIPLPAGRQERRRNCCERCSACIWTRIRPTLWARGVRCAMCIWWIPDWP